MWTSLERTRARDGYSRLKPVLNRRLPLGPWGKSRMTMSLGVLSVTRAAAWTETVA